MKQLLFYGEITEVNMSRRYEVILFDLDGTLTDTGEGVKKSVQYALSKQGIIEEDLRKLDKFIGPPLWESFKEFYAFTDEQVAKAIADYRERYSDKGLYENTIYPGMRELLQKLFDEGRTLLVATSKPEHYAKIILNDLGIDKYFRYIAGASQDASRSKKHEVINYALEKCGIEDKESVVLVGDTRYDAIGAAACGIDCVGILFGYGSRDELEANGAVAIAETVAGIYECI